MEVAEIHERIKDIPGWFDEDDIEAFRSLNLRGNPMIVECGTYCGRSATVLSLLWPQATIVTCDPKLESDLVKLRSNITFYNLKGIDVAMSQYDDVDLLFIDDSHYYDDIKANFEHFLPFMKSGGYVVFHDYYFETEDVDGVRRFCNELGGGEPYPGKYGGYIWQKP